MRKLFETVPGSQRITVLPTQRVLEPEKGRFRDVLGPGERRLPRRDIALEWHDLNRPVFESAYADALLRDDRPFQCG